MSKIYYSPTHEYIKVEGNIGYIGITDYAQHQLGNVVYVDMPEVDDEVTAGEDFGAIESVKAASDLISPVSGKVIETNEALVDARGYRKYAATVRIVGHKGTLFRCSRIAIVGPRI